MSMYRHIIEFLTCLKSKTNIPEVTFKINSPNIYLDNILSDFKEQVF